MLSYYNRILRTYLRPGGSNLSFWHETPELNPAAFEPDSCAYFMTFTGKAEYPGPFDGNGVPLLDYRGDIGRQYNPIAIAQYGLALINKADCRPAFAASPTTAGKTQTADCRLQTADRRPAFAASPATAGKTQTADISYKVTQLQSCKGQIENHVLRSAFHVPQSAIACADWLVENLVENQQGVKVWMHRFDWPYFQLLKAPWYSGLAQGQGISLLLRVWRLTGDERYLDAAVNAFEAMTIPTTDGGVQFVDEDGDVWLEEYITAPPTHILNGFIWGLWGVRDLVVSRESLVGSGEGEEKGRVVSRQPLAGSGGMGVPASRFALSRAGGRRESGVGSPLAQGIGATGAEDLWQRCVRTLEHNLARFDSGFWSLYDLAPVGIKNPASPFYHRLHIVQLRVMHQLTGKAIFAETADRWEQYAAKRFNRHRAFANKCLFKLKYY